MTKSEIISSIIENDIDAIMEDTNTGDFSYIADILRDGMKGYIHFTDQELIDEYNERFEEPITEIEPE